MSTSASSPPPISHILETCLYVRDIEASTNFYKSALNMEPFLNSPRVTAFNLGSTTLLLFKLGSTQEDITINTEKSHGIIPSHGPKDSNILNEVQRRNSLNQHFCFAVKSPQDVEEWHKHFQNRGVRVLGTMDWELGGKSVYFEDPDGHVGEIGSRGIWKHY
ncbi:conserved hypothetical protein [Talaromyces stipitatus ATCC 10500]|uniref:VOC domain-containing protein n=1 Tax=Talaromyces stipitatus (strain ATCC 10500 / CBS 375.48 / QM 6759 / NRRL 1006) TaxID=441959 RepID=B8LZC5_TALSN|nr:uncharacterized protein TSTA_089140 [Talaromyces stipitatus ATCC 10500]EED21678.1 conserved hypothetical protein [Talaromyces stipitatus ATCC 10500]